MEFDPRLMRTLVGATAQASDFIPENPEGAARTAAGRLGISEAGAEESMSHLEYSVGLNLAEVEEHVNLMVRSVRARGPLVEVDIRVGGVTLTARAPAGSGELSSVREGEELFVKLPIRRIRTLTDDRP